MLNTMEARKSDRISTVLQRAARTVGVLGPRSGGTIYDDIFNVSTNTWNLNNIKKYYFPDTNFNSKGCKCSIK